MQFNPVVFQGFCCKPVDKFHQKRAKCSHHHHITDRPEVADSFSFQVILNHLPGSGKKHFQRIEKPMVHMKNRMRDIVEKIFGINAVFMRILSAVRAIVPDEKFTAVFTFMPLHFQK